MLRFRSLSDERGAISIADVLIVLVSAVFIGAVAVPFMLGQQADMHKRAAALAAKSIAVEVETYLIVHGDDQVPSPVAIAHNPGTQRLSIPLASTRGTPESEIPFTLGNGISLATPNPSSPSLAGANTIHSRDNYCVAVNSFGQTAFHSNKGPTDSCPAPVVTTENESSPTEAADTDLEEETDGETNNAE